MALRQIIDDEDAVRVALVVGSYDIGIVLREILPADTLHVTKDMCEKKEAVLGYDIPKTSFGRVLLVKMLMVVSPGHLGLCIRSLINGFLDISL